MMAQLRKLAASKVMANKDVSARNKGKDGEEVWISDHQRLGPWA